MNGRQGTAIPMYNERLTIFEAITQSGLQDAFDIKNDVFIKSNYNIFDLAGNLILSGEIETDSKKINLDGISSGMYILQLDLIQKKYFYKNRSKRMIWLQNLNISKMKKI